MSTYRVVGSAGVGSIVAVERSSKPETLISTRAEPRRLECASDTEQRQWLPRHAAGDHTAFRRLMQCYGPAVMGYVIRCGVPPSLRDDVFQDIFFKIHRNASRYSPAHPLRPWLFTVTANVVRSHFRKQGVLHRVFSPREIESEPACQSATAVAQGEANEVAVRLNRSIAKLPMKQREVLSLVCIEGMALDEVAVALSMPLNSVKTNLQRARKAMRRELERYELAFRREVHR
ncbi:MAG: RNA polymerase sigma factor [Myxococcota bacterium]